MTYKITSWCFRRGTPTGTNDLVSSAIIIIHGSAIGCGHSSSPWPLACTNQTMTARCVCIPQVRSVDTLFSLRHEEYKVREEVSKWWGVSEHSADNCPSSKEHRIF